MKKLTALLATTLSIAGLAVSATADASTGAASLTVDGTSLWSHAPTDPPDGNNYTITLPANPHQLSLTASYDSAQSSRRPWFGNAAPYYGYNFPAGAAVNAAYVLCAS